MKKPLAYLMIFALFFTATAEAKKKRKRKGMSKAQKEQVERKKKRDAEKQAVDGLLDERDTDKNGLLKLEEWLIGEDDEASGKSKFVDGDKNKDRYLSRSEIGTMLGF